ncbi:MULTISPECIES: YggT family protein [Sporosarcina]|uniref:YggT family protein n=2 Tax=Sporosarcina newyorkensis TaxID=759851 RepID=A0A1T4YGE5_9BACL|nr:MULTISPECIES: YggT family protein [Sporosarcina]EGQ27265.1 YlmG protein [Sporosarcina newyorkensis 2681]MBY0222133.1 YggT family protein [Sporosarcina aquimarina]SKB00361.1 YggT family protein [Sporosarcina newyorkensis]
MIVLLNNAYLLISGALQVYSILLVIYILMSWVPSTRETKFGQILGKLTEPYLGFFRKFIPPLGMIDISPIAAIFALQLIGRGIGQIYLILFRALV